MLRTPNMILEARDGRHGQNWAVELLAFLGVFIAASILEEIPLFVTLLTWIIRHPEFLSDMLLAGEVTLDLDGMTARVMQALPDWYFIFNLYCTALAIAVCLFTCRVIQKRSVRTLGLRRQGALGEYLVGAAGAIAAMSAIVGLGLLAGVFSIEASAQVSMGTILMYFFGFLIQGMSEEVLCRGYLMSSIARKNPVWLAVMLNSLVFALLHLANPGISWLSILNLLTFGVFASIYVLKRGNLWGACAFHSLWNFTQGQLYGIPVSGNATGESFFRIRLTGTALWTGGDFGVEGSLLVTLILAVGIGLLLFVVPEKKGEFPAE